MYHVTVTLRHEGTATGKSIARARETNAKQGMLAPTAAAVEDDDDDDEDDENESSDELLLLGDRFTANSLKHMVTMIFSNPIGVEFIDAQK